LTTSFAHHDFSFAWQLIPSWELELAKVLWHGGFPLAAARDRGEV